jgi:hypothetical protein
MDLKHTEVKVRNTIFKLMTYTRSLELCAKMNYETENLDFIETKRYPAPNEPKLYNIIFHKV